MSWIQKVLGGIVVTLSGMTAQAAPTTSLIDYLDANSTAYANVADTIWDYAELGYLEEKSSGLLQSTLAAEGFSVQAGVAGIPTAFVASYGSGEPVIALLAEFDALPGISQSRQSHRDQLVGKAAGHACGHHLFGAGSVAAAIAVRHWMEQNDVAGTVRLYGSPAEEGGAGKVYLARAGLFADVDTVLHWHPWGLNSAAAGTSLANRSAKFRFHGVSAHAAVAPERGRSALDGVEAMNYMANLMREHVPVTTRIHYVITQGGHAPNVVPDSAEVFYYLRHPNAATLKKLWSRLEAAAQGAAQGTGTDVEIEIIHGSHSLLPNEALAAAMHENLLRVGGVNYSPEEQTYADEIEATLGLAKSLRGQQAQIQPQAFAESLGSTDVGDVSWQVPTAGLQAATWVPGTAPHSWQAIAAGGTSIGHKGMMVAAKTLALMTAQLLQDEQLIAAARAEFEERRGEDFVYEALLGDREPPLDYRL